MCENFWLYVTLGLFVFSTLILAMLLIFLVIEHTKGEDEKQEFRRLLNNMLHVMKIVANVSQLGVRVSFFLKFGLVIPEFTSLSGHRIALHCSASSDVISETLHIEITVDGQDIYMSDDKECKYANFVSWDEITAAIDTAIRLYLFSPHHTWCLDEAVFSKALTLK